MHTLIFADGVLGAKNARGCSQKQYFDAGMERKMAIGTAKRAKRANTITNNALIDAAWEAKKQKKILKLLEVVLQKCCPRSSRNNNFENM